MAVKVLVNALGQHILADTKQIENKETGDVVGYWLGNLAWCITTRVKTVKSV